MAGPEELLAEGAERPRPVTKPSSAQPPYSTVTSENRTMIGSR
jgi:hypothetical protein